MDAQELRQQVIDWTEVGEPPDRATRQRRLRLPRPPIAAALVAVLVAAPFGVAATGDAIREGVRNGTTAKETEIIGSVQASGAAKGGYVTRQSNVATGAGAGGAAIYGCRGAAGGTQGGSAPCLRASNLANGRAFEFAAKHGPAGLFEAGDPASPPFEVRGAGVVTGLNADRVDGLDAADLRGPAGPAGPTGPPGPTGPAGDPAVVDARNLSAAPFVDLTGGSFDDVYTPSIQVTESSFMHVAAHIRLDGNGGNDDEVECRLVWRTGGGTTWGGYARTDIPDTTTDITTLSTSAVLATEPGQYDVGVECQLLGGAVQVERVNLPIMLLAPAN